MGSLAKQKGAGFERKICQRLSLWVSGMTREDVFWRSAMSGGRATLRSRRNRRAELTAQAGDITATHELGHFLLKHFLLECKFYKDLKWEIPVYGGIGELGRIWQEPSAQARKHERMPMVIAKQNLKEEVVLLDRAGRAWLSTGLKPGTKLAVTVVYPAHGVYISAFRDLLANVDFDTLRNRWEHLR